MKTIELTDEQWAALNSGEDVTLRAPKKVAQWEPKGGKYFINPLAEIKVAASSSRCKAFGAERATREQATAAAKEMRTFNRLLAYRDDLDPEYKENWDGETCHYYVYFGVYSKRCSVKSSRTERNLGTVYTSKPVAVALADKLNSGEVVL